MGALKIWNGSGWEYVGRDGADGSSAFVQLYDSILGSDTATFDITGISSSYNHLRLVTHLRTDESADASNCTIRFNNDSSSLYNDEQHISQDTSVVGVSRNRGAAQFTVTWMAAGANQNAANFAGGDFSIENYANSSHRKNIRGHVHSWNDNSGTPYGTMTLFAGHYQSVTALTRITIFPGGGSNFKTGSRVTLYGLL